MKDLNINRSKIVTISLVIIFNIILQFIPLASIFGYEFSVLNAVFFFLLSGILTINRKSEISSGSVADKDLLVTLLICLFIPPLISAVHTLLTIQCSLWDGLSFYLVNTVPSVLFGFAAGLFCLKITSRFPRILFLLFFLIIIIIPLVEIYFNPQVYVYNLFAGFFPGTIYDEAISVNSKLIVYRIFNLLFFISIIYFLLKVKRRLPAKVIFLYVIVAPAAFILISPYLGFSSTQYSMEQKLGGKCNTPHFNIIYDKSIDTALLKNIILHHECYYNDLKKFYRTKPKEKITSFLFSDSRQKGLLFGAENADVAKPWLGQIYTTAETYHSTLKHEISHIFSADFGTGLFKVAKGLNPALIEGMAMASDPFFDLYYVDHLAAAAYKYKYNIDLEGLYSGFSFFGNVSTLGYVYSGAFSNYLIQKYGVDRFTKWYSGELFDSVYNYKLRSAADDFFRYLRTMSSTANENTARLYFARQTIFTKACPRYTASRLKRAKELFLEQDYKQAEEIYRGILDITKSFSALSGLSNSLVKQKKEREALQLVIKESAQYSTGAYFYNHELLQANLHVMNNQDVAAEELYLRINKQDPYIEYRFITDLYLELLKRSFLKEYLLGSDSDKFKILEELNKDEIVLSSVPSLLEVAESIGLNKDKVMWILEKPWLNKDNFNSYSAYVISNYLMEKLDYTQARKYAALAYRYNKGGYSLFLRSHYLKSEWIYINSNDILDNVTFKND